MTTTFQSAWATLEETTAELQTANDELSRVTHALAAPDADVFNVDASDESVQSMRNSSPLQHTVNEELSPVPLRFTKAIPKAISKEMTTLIAKIDQARAGTTVYKGTKDGTVDE